MAVFRMIHGKLPAVHQSFLFQIIIFVETLQKQISRVGILPENQHNFAFAPFAVGRGRNAVFVQTVCNGNTAFAGKVLMKNPLDGGRFFRNDGVGPAVVSVSEHSAIPWHTFLEVFSDAPFLIFTGRAAFLLRK